MDIQIIINIVFFSVCFIGCVASISYLVVDAYHKSNQTTEDK